MTSCKPVSFSRRTLDHGVSKYVTLKKFNPSFYKIAMFTKPLHLKCGPATLLHQVELAYAEAELDTVGLDRSTQQLQIYVCVPPGLGCATQNHFFRLTCTTFRHIFHSCWHTVSQLEIRTLAVISSVINRAWANEISIMNAINKFQRRFFIECNLMSSIFLFLKRKSTLASGCCAALSSEKN